MENIKFIDITQLPEDLWQDAKNLIAIDSNGDVIKAAKQDSYTKDEIDDLLRDSEISADKLQNKIQINSASTDYVVTQPTVSGDSLVITDSMSDKNQYHTFGYDKEKTSRLNGLLPYGFIFNKNDNSSMCENWNSSTNTLTFEYYPSLDNIEPITVMIPLGYVENGSNYVTEIVIDCSRDNMTITSNGNQYKGNKLISFFGDSQLFKIYLDDSLVDLNGLNIQNIVSIYLGSGKKTVKIVLGTLQQGDITMFKSIMNVDDVLPTYLKLGSNYQLYGYYDQLVNTYDHPEHLSDYIRYSNDVKAYILTDKNTTFKTINGQQITGDGNIEISTDVDLSNLATKAELNAKQNVISDLETIRSGAALGATALQSVPSEYALKSEIPDITTKQDKLVSGSNIKTINGNSLLGSGNIVIEASADNVPTLQTTVEGTTNNYIYSSGRNDKYGVISDIKNLVSYEEDKASINTGWVYWGTSSVIDAAYGWSINGATTSQAGLMSASDKSKLDGIDLSTKQDTLVSGTNIKTVNGTSLLGSGNIEVSANVDLSDYYTKSQTNALVSPKLSQVTLTQAEYDALSTKEENVLYVISDAEDLKFKTINGQQITGDGNIELATKSELNTKQDVISDLDVIRSGAALGATALQSVPSGYALKSEIPDIATKQDKLVSGTNIKTINGNSLLGSGNIEVTSNVDLSGYYTKAEIDAMIGGASSTITEINNLVV